MNTTHVHHIVIWMRKEIPYNPSAIKQKYYIENG